MVTPDGSHQLGRNDYVCEEHAGDDEYLLGMVRDFIDKERDLREPCAVCELPGAPMDALLEKIVKGVHKFFEPAVNSVPWDEGDWALLVIDTYDVLQDLDIDGHLYADADTECR